MVKNLDFGELNTETKLLAIILLCVNVMLPNLKPERLMRLNCIENIGVRPSLVQCNPLKVYSSNPAVFKGYVSQVIFDIIENKSSRHFTPAC